MSSAGLQPPFAIINTGAAQIASFRRPSQNNPCLSSTVATVSAGKRTLFFFARVVRGGWRCCTARAGRINLHSASLCHFTP